MGVHNNVGFDRFPKQGSWLGKRCRVCFNYEDRYVMGTIIRDDHDQPFITAIMLDNGKLVLATECQYQPL